MREGTAQNGTSSSCGGADLDDLDDLGDLDDLNLLVSESRISLPASCVWREW